MRIISGEFKSRIIKNSKNNRTHPMSEKIRGALFNSIGDISGKTLLDAFAGTGSVAIEALSRGAVDVHAVEINPDSFETLKENRDLVTNESRLQVHKANIRTWLKNYGNEFDIAIADPPYDSVSIKALETVSEYIKKDGLLIVSLPLAEHLKFKNYKKIDEKKYGNAKLVFYRKRS